MDPQEQPVDEKEREKREGEKAISLTYTLPLPLLLNLQREKDSEKGKLEECPREGEGEKDEKQGGVGLRTVLYSLYGVGPLTQEADLLCALDELLLPLILHREGEWAELEQASKRERERERESGEKGDVPFFSDRAAADLMSCFLVSHAFVPLTQRMTSAVDAAIAHVARSPRPAFLPSLWRAIQWYSQVGSRFYL